eukprot:scaffold412398_cov52-Attheya_sp.AAC.1
MRKPATGSGRDLPLAERALNRKRPMPSRPHFVHHTAINTNWAHPHHPNRNPNHQPHHPLTL